MRVVPTIGRVVLVCSPGGRIATDTSGTVPALVCAVHSETMINVAGFDANGDPFKRSSLPLWQEGDPLVDGDFAMWMPYQVKKAAEEAASETSGA